jgi:hypothetical protein
VRFKSSVMESTAITSWKSPACRRAVTASSNATGSRIREQLADDVAADLGVCPELALDEAHRAVQADRKDIDGSRLRNLELAGDE